MNISLPQHEQDPGARARALERKRQTLAYKYTHIEPLAMVEEVPWAHKPRLRWWTTVLRVISENLANSLALRAERAIDQVMSFDEEDGVEADLEGAEEAAPEETLDELDDLINSAERVLDGELADVELEAFVDGELDGPAAFDDDDDGFFARLRRSLIGAPRSERDLEETAERQLIADMERAAQRVAERTSAPRVTGKAASLEDYDRLYKTLRLPEVRARFQSDASFARLRVAGPNPVMFSQTGAPGPSFPVTERHYQAVMNDPEDSLARAADEGRLYLSDYKLLEGLPAGCFPGPRKYMYAPKALYAVARPGRPDRSLRAVAIQLGQRPTTDGVITPEDGERWTLAKSVVLIADGCVHEPITHLARTHLLIEPFVVATERQLSPRHPLYALLRPHFEGTLYINNAAHKLLIAPEGGVNRLLSPTIDAARMAVVLGLHSYPFDQAKLPLQLARRGVDDPASLPDYPYRDDGLLLWEAIRDWASAYVGLYYEDDDAVQFDHELQDWARELIAWEGGRVTGFGQEGGLKTRAYLVDTLTILIFTGSAQHAAVNFPQFDLMSYAPAFPLAGFSEAEAGSSWFDLLPPLDIALKQTETARLLGCVYHTQLGRYDEGAFVDPRVEGPLRAFQAALDRAEATITARNKGRVPYPFLLPSRIPQSVNI